MVHHVKSRLSALCLLLGIVLASNGQAAFDPSAGLAALISDKANVGVVAGYSVNGETKWLEAAGFSCQDGGVPFETTTLTRIASISKNLTAVAVLQLVEQNRLALDAPIGQYLATLPDDKQSITVRQLLAHTSGLSQYLNDAEIENTTTYPTLQAALDVFIDRPLLFEPGAKYFYTSYGYVLLGRLIEAVSGTSYANYMQTHVFDVAGMTATGVEYSDSTYQNKACLYHNNGRKAKPAKANDLSNRVPGGGFFSTAGDLIKFGNALLAGKLIKRESLALMTQKQPVSYEGNAYGLGWYLYGPVPNEDLVIGHGGGQTGCTSQLMIVPKTQTVVVVLSNTSGTYPAVATLASNLISYSETQGR